MAWLALAIWLIVALAALPLGSGAFTAPALGVQPPLALAGLVLATLFAIDGVAGVAWAAAAVALAGLATAGAGTARLVADDELRAPPTRAAERAATFAGVALPMYAVAAVVSALAALAADGSL